MHVNLRMAFSQQHPDHPLTAVFDPRLARTDEELKNRASSDLHQIKFSKLLSSKARTVLLEVFSSWMLQRFKNEDLWLPVLHC